ncbi:tetratricopeptide repeat protein [Noviherbaspirillum aerium]|uniref:tetratricopeptide repeat protein n=1 Tax=Noviherbaspirillum aerium TaxID=2588497 RepID=UPI00124D8761|nr:tetratricopeptide repeat protein [Noviherbaspirillum aerium]
MNSNKLHKLGLALCALVLATNTRAQAVANPPDPYQEALQLMEQGNTPGAIDQIQDLLKTSPNHAGAWLDLALLYCEQGDAARARRIFDHVEQQFQPPPAIQELITHYRKSGCAPAVAPKGRFTFTVGGGHTDNANRGLANTAIDIVLPLGVTTVNLEGFTPKASVLAAVSANYVQEIQALPGVSWFAGLTEKQYPSVQELNQRSLMAGISQQRVFGRWLQEFDAVATHLSLDERSHQKGLLARGAVWLPVARPGQPRFGAELSLSRWRYPHQPAYDNKIIETGISMRWAPTDRLGLRATAGRVADLASNARPGMDRRGHYLNLGGQWLMSETYRLDAGLRLRRLQDEAQYSVLFGERRHRSMQRQMHVGIQMEKNPMTAGVWRLEWEGLQSRDNIPLFPYNSRTLSLSWQYQVDVF